MDDNLNEYLVGKEERKTEAELEKDPYAVKVSDETVTVLGDDGETRTFSPVVETMEKHHPQTKRPKPSKAAPVLEVLEVFVTALVLALVILTVVLRTGIVDGESMVPTMSDGDRYVISNLFYTPKQGDIVVFRPEIEDDSTLWIKRVIATEGQTVYINPADYSVYVDGEKLDEPYISGVGTIPHSTPNPITVPENSIFVMGDNRYLSHDSRYSDLGCVNVDELGGHVLFRFWPFNKIGVVKN